MEQKTPQQIRSEIEALEASHEDTWQKYDETMKESIKILEDYARESQALAELYAEEQLILVKERGNNG